MDTVIDRKLIVIAKFVQLTHNPPKDPFETEAIPVSVQYVSEILFKVNGKFDPVIRRIEL